MTRMKFQEPDVACVDCGYALHGRMPEDSACPECGCAVAVSRKQQVCMTRRDLAVLGCRLVSLGILVLYVAPAVMVWVRELIWTFSGQFSSMGGMEWVMVWSRFLTSLCYLLIAVGMWGWAPAISRKIFASDAGVRAPITAKALTRVGLFLLGLYFAVEGVAGICWFVIALGLGLIDPYLGGNGQQSVVVSVIEAVAGLVLLRQPVWLLRCVYGTRR